jgi:hypothetical protein
MKTLPINKSKRPVRFMAKFYQTFKEKLISILFKLFKEIESEGLLPNSFYEASIALITKPNENITRKENYRPISLMQRFSTEYWQTEFNDMSKKIIHHDQISYIPGMQEWLNICKSINVIQHIN